MAFYPEFKGPALDGYNRMVQKLRAAAEQGLGVSGEQIVVRSLRPEDLGLSNPNWGTVNITAANTFTAWVSAQTISSDRWVGIHGVYNNEAAGTMSQVKISREGSDARFWDVDKITDWRNTTGWVDDPITIAENTSVTVSVAARTASTISDMGLIGAVAERRGLLVNP